MATIAISGIAPAAGLAAQRRRHPGLRRIPGKPGDQAFYQYDFGDDWQHEVLYEGSPPLEKGKKYPICLEGERACPPEGVGGVWSYPEFLAAIADPSTGGNPIPLTPENTRALFEACI